jgi:membrane protein YdbS with pleckstrin-like domain
MVSDIKRVTSSARRSWNIVWQTAVWSGGIAFLALASPPRFLGSELPSDNAIKAIELVLAVCVGFCFFVFQTTSNAKRLSAYVAMAFLTVGVALFFTYDYQYAAWTCPFDGRGPVTVGSTLSQAAEKYIAENPGADCEQLLQVSAGKPDKIWPQSEIIAHHLTMIGTFFALVLLFALSILLMSVAITRRVNRHNEY